MKKVAMMAVNGSEPIEVLAPVDVLRRGGVEVTIVSCEAGDKIVTDQGIYLGADANVKDVDLLSFDMIVVPGGSGVEALKKNAALKDALTTFLAESRPVGSICAGPTVLNEFGLLEGRKVTCYPGCEAGLPAGVFQEGIGVVRDGNLVTASGPGLALDFGVALLRQLMGDDVAEGVARGMLMKNA
ncbi:DJ-1 family glyoxalase III [Xiamenia xianingshaonis]|uniref:DJ-1 family protein n=1 Tax=Xiamenia xianingshaonis TaxID=2682776 RepID=A0A9E6STT7_9ACTN|nr:DJ-1 family glyoxalase III [Xiamenia xianingshaonis]NGM17135.1 DJ-1 family protein [Eggerthellaceae bacterium zg-893]NHM13818.1 DJ-1 family protein [Xiamenia xianingshaonis]QTU83679.1 DJ-1/PfpI family protein [Xiamenia xianingshaonis]